MPRFHKILWLSAVRLIVFFNDTATTEIYTCWLREFFPCGICVTRPKGGFMLWVELPEQVDMVCVAKQLCRLKIQVAPGSLFSAAGKYRNCVRINCALPPTEKHKAVMVKLGEAVKVAME